MKSVTNTHVWEVQVGWGVTLNYIICQTGKFIKMCWYTKTSTCKSFHEHKHESLNIPAISYVGSFKFSECDSCHLLITELIVFIGNPVVNRESVDSKLNAKSEVFYRLMFKLKHHFPLLKSLFFHWCFWWGELRKYLSPS